MNLTVSRRLAWLAVPLIAVPAVILRPDTEPAPSPNGEVTMGAEVFGVTAVTVRQGETLLMRNDSHWLHVIVHGDGAVETDEPGSPSLGDNDVAVAEEGDVLRIGPWQHAGTFHITCQIHPEMNLTVDVVA